MQHKNRIKNSCVHKTDDSSTFLLILIRTCTMYIVQRTFSICAGVIGYYHAFRHTDWFTYIREFLAFQFTRVYELNLLRYLWNHGFIWGFLCTDKHIQISRRIVHQIKPLNDLSFGVVIIILCFLLKSIIVAGSCGFVN